MATRKKASNAEWLPAMSGIRDGHLKRPLCSGPKGTESGQSVPSAQLSHAGLSSPSAGIIRVRQPISHEAHRI